MKSITAALKTHIAQQVTTLAALWKIILQDSTEYYFTDHEKSIIFDGNTYLPSTGYSPSAIATNTNMAVDNQSVIGYLDNISISESDIRAGKFDYADVELFLVNYLAADIQGPLNIIVGKFGEVIIKDEEFSIELRGTTQLLQQQMGELYAVQCQAKFGDAKCGLNEADAAYTKTLTVTNVVGESKREFETNLTDDDNYFTGGYLTWTAGDNSGYIMDIKKYEKTNGIIELYEPMPNIIITGNTATIVVGCDKSLETCKTKFLASNIVNYRGFPYVTGMSTLLRGI